MVITETQIADVRNSETLKTCAIVDIGRIQTFPLLDVLEVFEMFKMYMQSRKAVDKSSCAK